VKRLRSLLAAAAYAGTLLWVYATILSPLFSYEGYRLAWPGPLTMVWLMLLALGPAPFLPHTLSRPSALIVWWLYLAAYIPSILVPALSLSMPWEKLLPLHLSLAVSMGLLCLVCSSRLLAIGQMKLSPTVFWSIFTLIWLAGLAFASAQSSVLANVGSLFTGATEYDIRGQVQRVVTGGNRVLAYVLGELGQALNPFLLALGIVRRRGIYLAAGIIGQLIVFGVTGFKTVVLSAIFLPLVYVLIRRWRRNFGLAFTSGVIAIILACAIVDSAGGSIFFSSLFTRRTLAGPGLLTGFYFDHFSQVSHTGIAYHLHRDASVLDASREIGLVYFGSSNVDANANLWAEGFADLGVPGVLGFTLIAVLIIWLYDSVARRRNLELAVLLVVMPAVDLSNSAPTTVLITHGGLAAAILLYLAPLPRPGTAEPEPEEQDAAAAH
jgi:hypothetical protein